MSKLPPATRLSYQQLLGEKTWQQLHPAIRRRFDATHMQEAVTYSGTMETVHANNFGLAFAQFCRLFGTPLTPYRDDNIAAKVEVYPDVKHGGMVWDRYYHHRNGKIVRVQSTKRIDVQHGLAEHIGAGLGMALTLSEENGALIFTSNHYFWQWGKTRWRLPEALTPGKTIVRQIAIDDKQFIFELDVQHPLLGQMYYQRGIFSAQ